MAAATAPKCASALPVPAFLLIVQPFEAAGGWPSQVMMILWPRRCSISENPAAGECHSPVVA
eukprot:4769186-Pleurochrysis_carterae.AAC.6